MSYHAPTAIFQRVKRYFCQVEAEETNEPMFGPPHRRRRLSDYLQDLEDRLDAKEALMLLSAHDSVGQPELYSENPNLIPRFTWIADSVLLDRFRTGAFRPIDMIHLLNPKSALVGAHRLSFVLATYPDVRTEIEAFANVFDKSEIWVAAWSSFVNLMVSEAQSTVQAKEVAHSGWWHLNWMISSAQTYRWAACVRYHCAVHLKRQQVGFPVESWIEVDIQAVSCYFTPSMLIPSLSGVKKTNKPGPAKRARDRAALADVATEAMEAMEIEINESSDIKGENDDGAGQSQDKVPNRDVAPSVNLVRSVPNGTCTGAPMETCEKKPFVFGSGQSSTFHLPSFSSGELHKNGEASKPALPVPPKPHWIQPGEEGERQHDDATVAYWLDYFQKDASFGVNFGQGSSDPRTWSDKKGKGRAF